MNSIKVTGKRTALKIIVKILTNKLNGVRDRKNLIKIIHSNFDR